MLDANWFALKVSKTFRSSYLLYIYSFTVQNNNLANTEAVVTVAIGALGFSQQLKTLRVGELLL